MGTKSSLHVQIRGWSMLTCWQVAWDDDLPVSFLSKIGCINLPPSGLALSHAPFTFSIPTGARSFTMLYQVISVHTLGPLQSLRPNHAAKRLRPSASSRFLSGTPLSPDPRARCLKTADTRTDTLEYLRYILELSWFDQHVHCRLWQVSLISHWLTGIQEESPLQMSKTRMNSEITCFNKNVLPWLWQRHVQNSGSCKSRVLWRWERDIKHPLKSGNPNTHWICWIWQKRKTSYKARLNLMELHHLLLPGKTLQNGYSTTQYNIGCGHLHRADVRELPGCRGRWENEAVFVSALGEHGVSHH